MERLRLDQRLAYQAALSAVASAASGKCMAQNIRFFAFGVAYIRIRRVHRAIDDIGQPQARTYLKIPDCCRSAINEE